MKGAAGKFGTIIVLGVLALTLAGCPPKKKSVTPVMPPVTEIPKPEEPALEVADTELVTAPGLETVYFETNKSDLRADARASLKLNAEVLKVILQEAAAVQVRVEGHCDERNTLEYNLALGQRRANAVRDYYATLGISKAALATISYGEERPVCAEHEESCWAKNRRGMTTLRSTSGPVRIPLSKLPPARP